ncbi:MAG: hypothetical protein GY787_14510 [Alteromonadales bacterium]|nr:hypothetical protein [Alteromonadales bacterium]
MNEIYERSLLALIEKQDNEGVELECKLNKEVELSMALMNTLKPHLASYTEAHMRDVLLCAGVAAEQVKEVVEFITRT